MQGRQEAEAATPIKLPLKPILTGSYPRWYGKGDEVAVYDRGEWWHAVVIDDVKPKYQNPCYVSTNRKNFLQSF